MALAQSMALPPPRATSSSGWNCFSFAVPSAARATVGSGCTASKYSTCSAPDSFAIRSAVPFFIK